MISELDFDTNKPFPVFKDFFSEEVYDLDTVLSEYSEDIHKIKSK